MPLNVANFWCRIKNIKSSDPIDLSTISMQYWLEGPETVLPYSQLNPDTYFLVRCDWATTGQAFFILDSCAVIIANLE